MSAPLPPGLRRLALRTPTLPPATATNTLIVGEEVLAVIEPATPHPDQQARLDAEIDRLLAEGRTVAWILVTHHHADHIGYAERLRDRLGVPLGAHRHTADRVPFAVDRILDEGDVLALGDDHVLDVLHTPGHAPGHLVFVDRGTRMAHVGDMVAAEGTILIDPDDAGDMGAYLRSLERLKSLGLSAVVPAHGGVIEDPNRIFDHYVTHRLGREAKVVAGIEPSGSDFDDVLARAYADTPRHLWPLAARSLEAHLQKLEQDGRVTRKGARIRLG